MKKLILLLALALTGCSNWQIWSAGVAATGFTSLVDVGITTTPSFTYRLDACLLSPYLLEVTSGQPDWDGYATGFVGGKLVMGQAVSCHTPFTAT